MYPSGGHPAHRGRIRHEDRVYPDQRSQFENGELFRKLTRESEVNIMQSPLPNWDDCIVYHFNSGSDLKVKKAALLGKCSCFLCSCKHEKLSILNQSWFGKQWFLLHTALLKDWHSKYSMKTCQKMCFYVVNNFGLHLLSMCYKNELAVFHREINCSFIAKRSWIKHKIYMHYHRLMRSFGLCMTWFM